MYRKVLWSPVEIEYLKKHQGEPVNQLCIALLKSRTAIKNKLVEIKTGQPTAKARKLLKGRSRIGKRPDLDGIFFRSSWEANLFRLLKRDTTIKLIEYEPTDFTFWQFGIKKGTVSYTPDFKITYNDGRYKWIEVKGQMKPQDKTKIRRFKKHYPDECNKLVAVVGSLNTKAAHFFNSVDVPIQYFYTDLNRQYKNVIPHWE